MTVGDIEYGRIESCEDGDGYVLDDSGDAIQIEVCGSACDDLLSVGTIDMGLACAPVG